MPVVGGGVLDAPHSKCVKIGLRRLPNAAAALLWVLPVLHGLFDHVEHVGVIQQLQIWNPQAEL